MKKILFIILLLPLLLAGCNNKTTEHLPEYNPEAVKTNNYYYHNTPVEVYIKFGEYYQKKGSVPVIIPSTVEHFFVDDVVDVCDVINETTGMCINPCTFVVPVRPYISVKEGCVIDYNPSFGVCVYNLYEIHYVDKVNPNACSLLQNASGINKIRYLESVEKNITDMGRYFRLNSAISNCISIKNLGVIYCEKGNASNCLAMDNNICEVFN